MAVITYLLLILGSLCCRFMAVITELFLILGSLCCRFMAVITELFLILGSLCCRFMAVEHLDNMEDSYSSMLICLGVRHSANIAFCSEKFKLFTRSMLYIWQYNLKGKIETLLFQKRHHCIRIQLFNLLLIWFHSRFPSTLVLLPSALFCQCTNLEGR